MEGCPCPACPECCSVRSILVPDIKSDYLLCMFGTENPRRWCKNVRDQIMGLTRTKLSFYYDRDLYTVCAYDLEMRLPDCSDAAARRHDPKFVCRHP